MTMMYGSGMGLFWVWPLLLVAGMALVVWAVVRGSSGAGSARPTPPADRSHEILRERFARGEITEEQLRQGRRALDER